MSYSVVERNEEQRSFIYIALVVITLHILLVAYSALFFPKRKPIIVTPKKILVQTVSLKKEVNSAPATKTQSQKKIEKEIPQTPAVEEPIEKIAEPIKEEPTKKKIPEPESSPAAKPKPSSKPAKKIDKKKEKTPAKKTEPKKSENKKKETAPKKDSKPKTEEKKEVSSAVKNKKKELLAQAKKNIAQIDSSHAKLTAKNSLTLTIPSEIIALNVDAVSEGFVEIKQIEQTYFQELASFLKMKLKFPEYGEVRLKLTIERTGKFIKATVVQAESAKNRQYAEKALSGLKYPSFGNSFPGQDEFTFTITLSNE